MVNDGTGGDMWMYAETACGVTWRIDAIMQRQAWVVHVETTGDGTFGIDTAMHRQAWVTVGVVFYTSIFGGGLT